MAINSVGAVQKSPFSKAVAIFARRAYWHDVGTEKGRERRWRLFSTDPVSLSCEYLDHAHFGPSILMSQETTFIGFGSNLGDRQDFCDRAIALLYLLPLSQVTGVSSYYETEPVDPEGKQGEHWFYNGVVQLDTSLSPMRLLDILQETERGLGREDASRQGPRTMDFDILLFGQHCIEQPGLTIPHPRLHLRRFVLEPLVELDSARMHPVLHRSMQELLDSLKDFSRVNKLSLKPGLKYQFRPACSIPPFS